MSEYWAYVGRREPSGAQAGATGQRRGTSACVSGPLIKDSVTYLPAAIWAATAIGLALRDGGIRP
jgi:hypothetical protein